MKFLFIMLLIPQCALANGSINRIPQIKEAMDKGVKSLSKSRIIKDMTHLAGNAKRKQDQETLLRAIEALKECQK